MSDIKFTQMKSDGSMEESGEAQRLRKSLDEMEMEERCGDLLKGWGLFENALDAISEGSTQNHWSWSEVKKLYVTLLHALDAGI